MFRVTFPENLNLNAFISNQNQDGDSPADDRDITVKCDDCSTTDSGSALDDENCQIVEGPSTVNGQDLNCQEEDEGIDMTITSNQQENIKNANQGPKGPYIYELFSIMIHSGGASGGHYYAYIKDFQTRSWYCFNDQNVSRVSIYYIFFPTICLQLNKLITDNRRRHQENVWWWLVTRALQ